MSENNTPITFPHLKEMDLQSLDARRAEIVALGAIGDLPDDSLRELVAIAAQIRQRSGRVPKEEKEPKPAKTVKKAKSLEELDLDV